MADEWQVFPRAKVKEMLEEVDTKYPLEKLREITKVLSTLPSDKKFIRKIERLHLLIFPKRIAGRAGFYGLQPFFEPSMGGRLFRSGDIDQVQMHFRCDLRGGGSI